MSEEKNSNSSNAEASPDYEAPKVETVITPKDLEREVQYAGFQSQVNG